MSHHRQVKEVEEVVRRVFRAAAKYKSVGKKEFESILQIIMEQVQKNTGLEAEKISAVTQKVIEDMPNEYGQLSPKQRSWEGIIAYLYAKYLKELGRLD